MMFDKILITNKKNKFGKLTKYQILVNIYSFRSYGSIICACLDNTDYKILRSLKEK